MNGKPFTDEVDAIILAGRDREEPIRWDLLGKVLDRSPASVRYRYALLTGRRLAGLDVAEPSPNYHLPMLAEWPDHARFDGKRTHTFKPSKVPPIFAIPHVEVMSHTGNAAAMCAESRGASNPR